jgi:hypothetical protein
MVGTVIDTNCGIRDLVASGSVLGNLVTTDQRPHPDETQSVSANGHVRRHIGDDRNKSHSDPRLALACSCRLVLWAVGDAIRAIRVIGVPSCPKAVGVVSPPTPVRQHAIMQTVVMNASAEGLGNA